MEISSSGYHIQSTGDITASRILIEGGTITDDVTILGSISANSILTPATIGGSPANASNASASISDQGLAIFRSASIAGFVINTEEIKSENENLRLKASGQITGSNVLLSGGTITDGVTILGSVTANSIQTPATIGGSPSTPSNASSSISSEGLAIFKSASIAGFTINTEEIKSSDESLRLKSIGQMTGSSILLGDKAGGNFVQFAGSTMTVRGDISVDQIFTPATIGGSPATVSNASSSITSTGFAKFTSASIGGWDITTNSIEGGNLIMKPEGILQTKDFASGLKGWKISSEGNGTAEFENVRIRGTLRTTTFEKESVNAVGGQLWVTNATTISGSNVTANDTTMSIANASGFTVGEILLSKKVDGTGFQTEYLLVESASIDGDNTNADEVHGRIYVQRGYGSGSSGAFVGDLASTSQSYDEGQVIVSTGLSGSGYIKMNANPRDTATPFMDIVERTGSGLYDVLLKARLGDLSGIANTDRVFGASNPGFGLATDNVFLQGGIRATTGSIGGIEMESNKLYIGTGVHANSNTGFYVDSSSNFSLGDKLTWNGSALTVQGQLRLSSGQTVDEAINEATASNTAKTLVLTSDSQVFAFPSASSTTSTPTSIIFSIAQQNLSASISASDVTITTADGDDVTGFSFDTGSVTANSSTPPLYSGVVSGSLTFAGNLNAGGLDSDKANLPVSIVATKDGLSDTTTIFKIEGGTSGSSGTDGTDGTDAITAFLTNESHTFPADVSGNVSSFAGGTTDMKLFQGITDVTNNYTYTGSNTTGVTATSSSNALTITGLSVDSGSVTFTANSGSTSLSKIMSLAKSKQGSQGSAGSSAKLISVTTDSQIFSFLSASSNVALDDDILIIINHQNLTSSPLPANITIKDQSGTTISNPTFISSSISGTGQISGSITFSSTLGADKSKLPISIEVSKDSVSDITRVFKVEGGTSGSSGTDGSDGSDAITAFLTNESHTFPANAAGTVSDFSSGTTDMVVFLGLQNVTSSFTFTGSNSIGVTATSSSKSLTVTGMTHDSGSIDFTAVSASISLTKTMTLSKSKTGQTGSTAKTLVLTSDSQVFSFPSASSSDALDDDILLIINQQNLSGTIGSGDITITDSGGSTLSDPSLVADVTNGSGQVSGSITFSSTVSGNKTKLPLTVTVAKDGLSDTTRIFKLEGGSSGSDGSDGAAGADGSPAVTAFLTNEAHTFPADVNGNISSFTEASSSMVVFVGLTNSTSSFSFSRTNGLGVTSTLGGTHGNILAISAMTHDSGSVDITATSASVSVTKTMTLAKSKQGAVGSTGQTGPTGPNFDFLTGSLSEVDTSGGLSKGLLMTSTVLGFHEDIAEGDGTNATINDFSSFLDNTGNFFIGKNTAAHFAFSSASATLLVSGSNVDIRTPKFFLGSKNSQFVSGSNGLLEISSSNFHLTTEGNVTMSGTITATAGNIGGFEITDTQINSSNDNLILKSSGQVTASTLLLTGGSVGGIPVSSDEISVGSVLKLKNSGQITGSNVLFDGGEIGGFEIDSTKIEGTPTTTTGNIVTTINTNVSASFTELNMETVAFTASSFRWDTGTVNDNTVLPEGSTYEDGSQINHPYWNTQTPNLYVSSSFPNTTVINAFVQLDPEGGIVGGAVPIAPIDNLDKKTLYLGTGYGVATGSSEVTLTLIYDDTTPTSTTFVSSSVSSSIVTTIDTSLKLDASEKSISIATSSYGDTGIQLEYNSGTPRFFAGTDTGSFFKYDGTNLSISSSNFSVTNAGEVSAKQIELEDYSKADYFVFKLLTITTPTSASYLEEYTTGGKTYYKLVLDGTLGGSIAQSVRMNIHPQYPIGMIQPPVKLNNQGHEVTIECANGSGVGYANLVAVSGSSAYHYGFWADSDDWFYQLYQTRAYGVGGTYGGGSVGDIGASSGRVLVQNIGQRFKWVRSAYDFRLLGISSYDTTGNGQYNSQGLINFYSGLQTSNGPIGVGIGTTTKMTAGYALEVQSITDRAGTSTADAYFHGNVSGSVFSGSFVGDGSGLSGVSGGGGGISFNGSTANGLLTYGNSSTADVESNMTFDGTNLLVSDDSNAYANIGRTRIGYATYNDYAYFSHRDNVSAGQYALIQASGGDTFLNAVNGQEINFRINNSDKMVMTATGLNVSSGHITASSNITAGGSIGIGTADPAQKLTVNGTDARIYLTGANTDIAMDASANGQLHLDGNGYGFGIAVGGSHVALYHNSDARNLVLGTNETARLTIAGNSGNTTCTGTLTGTGLFAGSAGKIGADTTDYISFTNNTRADIYINNSNEFRFESDGDFHADGDVIASSTTISDFRLKDNIITISGALDKIKSLRGVSYTWNSGKKKGKQDIGLIAQEVEEIIPEIVKDKKMPLMDGIDPNETYKTIDYEKIIAVLVEAVKDQQEQIDELKKKIN